jgi:hypothetical protein
MVAMAQSSPLWGVFAASVDQIFCTVHDIWQLPEFCRHLATVLKKLGRFLPKKSIQWLHLPRAGPEHDSMH